MQKTFELAHINEQGQNMIIIPLEPSFACKSSTEQNQICSSLEIAAHEAGLAGKVVLVWKQGRMMSYLAPRQWHAFFKSIAYDQILLSINKKLTVNV